MTNMLELSEITLEGPDLSGKTTLYRNLHQETDFKWNIQDRAEISMAIYSEMYGRPDAEKWWSRVREKLLNLNHRYVILIPHEDLMLERFEARGDDMQDAESLVQLRKRFVKAASKLSKFGTCIIVSVTKRNQSDVKQEVLEALRDIESVNTFGLCMQVLRVANAFDNDEAAGLRFNIDLTDFDSYDYDVLNYEKEREYYDRITRDYTEIVEREMMGDNEYGAPQDPRTTRRFVYTDSSCISYINTQVRDRCMTMRVVCRSSDVQNTFFYDISFLQILSLRIKEILIKTCEVERVIMNVRLDSAHILDGTG